MSRNAIVNPALLAELDDEVNYESRVRKDRWMPRIKIDKGQSFLLRFLPVQIGTNKSWFVRYAQHWVNNKTYFCRRHTSQHIGGDPNYECPICQMSESLGEHTNEAVASRASKAAAGLKYWTSCLLLGKDLGHGQQEMTPDRDLHIAHEYSCYRTVMEQLTSLQKIALRRNPVHGILDIDAGSDIWINRSAKRGILVSKEDPAPIINPEEMGISIDEFMAKVWETVKLPDIKFSSEEEELEIADKLEGHCYNGDSEPAGRGSSRQRGRSNQHEDNEPPVSSRGFSRGASRQHAQDLDEDDQAQESPAAPTARAAAPARTSAPISRQAPAPTRAYNPPPVSRTVAEPENAPIEETEALTESNPAESEMEAAPVLRQVPVAAPAVAAPTRAPATRQVAPPPARRVSPAPTPAPIPRSSAPVVGASPEEEEEGLAPEVSDPAPPVSAPVEEMSDPVAPPPVKAVGSKLSPALAASLAKLKK